MPEVTRKPPKTDQSKTVVQSVICLKTRFKSAEQARSWIADHGFYKGGMEETDESYRFRQYDPKYFEKMRTIELTKGVKAIVGRAKQTAAKDEFRHRVLDGIVLSDSDFANTDGNQINHGVHKVACEGKWDGHPMGPFSLNEQMFIQMRDYFAGQKIETVVDYEHGTLGGFGQQAPAAGWVKSLDVRKNGDNSELWANIEWTNKAAEMIRSKEYRYLSPTILFNRRDKKTGVLGGAALHSVGLTNTPFLEELPEVRLNSIKAALAVKTETIIDEEKNQMDETIRALAVKLGLAEDASSADILAAVANKEKEKDEEIVALKANLEAEKENKRKVEAEALVASARRDGKVTAQNQEWATEYALKDPEGFQKFITNAPKIAPIDATKNPPKEDKPKVGDTQMRAYKAFGLSDEIIAKYGRKDN